MSRRPLSEETFTVVEQLNLRNALYVIRLQCGSWKAVSRQLGFEENTIQAIAAGYRNVSSNVALRLAKLAGTTAEALIDGRFPPVDRCALCGFTPPKEPSVWSPPGPRPVVPALIVSMPPVERGPW